MHRRRLLACCGAMVGLAGCSATDDADDGTTGTDTDTEGPSADGDTNTATDTDGTALTVERARVYPRMVELRTPDMIGTTGGPDDRFVLVTVDATAASTPPDAEAVTLLVDGREYDPTIDLAGLGAMTYHGLGSGSVYGVDGASGDLAFEVPSADEPPSVTLSWPGGETTLEVGEALARPRATFAVESFRAESDRPQRVALSATVRNTGETPGRFVAALNRRGPSVAVRPVAGVDLALDPGETGTRTHTDRTFGDGSESESGTARYTLVAGGEEYETSVEVEL